MINITSDGLPIVDQTNRTSVVPQNTLVSSSSLGQFPPSISTNNVIVLHRGVARKTFTSTPSIRIGPNAPVYTQTILSGNYSTLQPHFPVESNAVIRSINETVNNSNTNIIPSSHLLHTSRLGTILEVDLDSENYDEQSNNTDYSNSDTSVKNSQNIPIISNSSLSSFDSPRITTLHKSTISTSDETAVNQFRNSSNHELYDTTGLCTKMNEQPSNNITSLNIIVQIKRIDYHLTVMILLYINENSWWKLQVPIHHSSVSNWILGILTLTDCNKLDSIDSLSKQIQSAAAILLRIDLLGDCDILKEFSAIFFEDQFDILNRLRCLRQWAATVPDLLNSDNLYYCVNQSRKSVFDSSKNFLDSLLLCLFSKDRITSYWDFVPVNVRSNVILSLSVCLQVIINLLSESTYSVELFDTNSLFTVLLSGSRPLILLTDHGMKLWLSDCHQLNHDRISSHYCYLVYLLLLRIQQTGSNIPEYILENIHHKIMRNKSVIWALVMEACQSSEESVPGKHLHFQLLLTQLATELVRHVIPPTNNVVINLEENFIKLYIDITGLALLLLCPDWADESLSQSQCEARKILPTSGKSCLGYWFSFLSLLHPSEMNCVMDILLMEFAALSLSWTKELIACSPENERWVNVAQNDSVSLLDRNYPCARLRGLVHILASISFSNLSTEKVVPSNESGCFRSEDLPCELQSPTSPKFSFITHQENEKLCESDKKMLITQDRADRLCKLLCNLLVTLHFATVKLEKFHSISDSVDSSLPLRSECNSGA
ncbi:unnamed protein product [Heterobilharzia americana]|nr:unnamed protein product [Heterobilharzia americana]